MVGQALVGHADNSAYPAITVDIQMTLVVPAGATKPVPGDDHVRQSVAAI